MELLPKRQRYVPLNMKAKLLVEYVRCRVLRGDLRHATCELLGKPWKLRLHRVDDAVVEVPTEREARIPPIVVVERVTRETTVYDPLWAKP